MKIETEDLNLDIGLGNLTNLYLNCSNEELVEDIVLNGEGVVGLNGAAMVDTGKFTGRSQRTDILLMKLLPMKKYGGER